VIKNRERLNYPHFRKLGLCTSRGIVESGCRHVIGARVKQSGMRWTVKGANNIIALRCSIKGKNIERQFFSPEGVPSFLTWGAAPR